MGGGGDERGREKEEHRRVGHSEVVDISAVEILE